MIKKTVLFALIFSCTGLQQLFADNVDSFVHSAVTVSSVTDEELVMPSEISNDLESKSRWNKKSVKIGAAVAAIIAAAIVGVGSAYLIGSRFFGKPSETTTGSGKGKDVGTGTSAQLPKGTEGSASNGVDQAVAPQDKLAQETEEPVVPKTNESENQKQADPLVVSVQENAAENNAPSNNEPEKSNPIVPNVGDARPQEVVEPQPDQQSVNQPELIAEQVVPPVQNAAEEQGPEPVVQPENKEPEIVAPKAIDPVEAQKAQTDLVNAIKNQNNEEAGKLLATYGNGCFAPQTKILRQALIKKNNEMVDLLLAHDCPIADDDIVVAYLYDFSVAQKIVEKSGSKIKPNKAPAIFRKILQKGNAENLQFFLTHSEWVPEDFGKAFVKKDTDGHLVTPFQYAVESKNGEMIRELLDRKVSFKGKFEQAYAAKFINDIISGSRNNSARKIDATVLARIENMLEAGALADDDVSKRIAVFEFGCNQNRPAIKDAALNCPAPLRPELLKNIFAQAIGHKRLNVVQALVAHSTVKTILECPDFAAAKKEWATKARDTISTCEPSPQIVASWRQVAQSLGAEHI